MLRFFRDLLRAALVPALLIGLAACETPQPGAHTGQDGQNDAVMSDRFVEALGVQMRFRVIEGNGPVILLEAGSGLGAETWAGMAEDLSAATGSTVISYDRAGMGESQMPPGPYDIYQEMARLHRGLVILGHAEDLILVGHSYGGFLIHIYANLYPEAVSGVVYVDANTPMSIDAVGGPDAVTGPSIRRNDVEKPSRKQRAGLRLSHGFAKSMESVSRYPPLCHVPTVVISAGRYSDRTPQDVVDGWQAGHRDLARRSGGEHVIARASGHMVHQDEPEVIVSAVSEIIADETRKSEEFRPEDCPGSG